MGLISNFLYTLLATVFSIPKSESKRIKSLIRKTKTMKRMTFFQKTKRIYLLICIHIEIHFRQGSLCILSAYLNVYQKGFFGILFQKIKRLEKKGYIVQVELLTSENMLLNYDSNVLNQLKLQANLKVL